MFHLDPAHSLPVVVLINKCQLICVFFLVLKISAASSLKPVSHLLGQSPLHTTLV